MKKFLSGVLCTTLVFSLALSALAISGRMTIEVDPINIQVNGETFQPTDVTGKEVPVFAYQGTTYAPLRALAEAYGLEVGYAAEANMASVNDPGVKPAATPAPDTAAKDELVVYDEDGKVLTGCEFDTTSAEVNGKIASGEMPITIIQNERTYVNFEMVVSLLGLDEQFDSNKYSKYDGGYLTIGTTHYVRPIYIKNDWSIPIEFDSDAMRLIIGTSH